MKNSDTKKLYETRWVTCENLDGVRRPLWMMSAAVLDDGRVFIPAIYCGNEMAVMLCALDDGALMLHRRGHSYVHTDWASSAFPELRELCETITRRIREALDKP